MRKATARRLVKFVTHAPLNKIKLKGLLHCQDKGQAAEIIFHSQTLNYPGRLDQIQSGVGGRRGGKKGGREGGKEGRKEENVERSGTSRNKCESC